MSFHIIEMAANGWRISRRRVKQCAHQSKTYHITETGNNEILDQAVGCMRWVRPVRSKPRRKTREMSGTGRKTCDNCVSMQVR